MSEDHFLARWSRRKREAEETRDAALPANDATLPAPAEGEAERPKQPEQLQPEQFDVASLPSIDSITGSTDITAFLQSGVPGDLTRAALRRAWSSDPVIRDFVGLAENAWDFTDPNAMPGFGPLEHSPEAVREMVARAMGEVAKTVESAADDSPGGSNPTQTVAEPLVIPPETASPANEASLSAPEMEPPVEKTASVITEPEQEPAVMLRRTHGGALPR